MLRWLFLIRYSDNVPIEEGERWYLGTHAQEAKHLKNLESYKTWRAHVVPPEMRPGTAARPLERPEWYRVTELGFKDMAAWREGQLDRRDRQQAKGEAVWTPPPYAGPGFISEQVFISDEPEYDFLTQMPRLP
jgi:hypothetical protein